MMIFNRVMLLSLIISILILLPKNAFASTDVPAGEVSGVWTKLNSPYYINGEIIIPDGETLNIDPGVEVIFNGHFRFIVKGCLMAIGIPQDTIVFTSLNKETSWYGLRFDQIHTTNDSSKLIYCKIQYAYASTDGDLIGGGVLINNTDRILIMHCLITKNRTVGDIYTGGAGIGLIASSPRIEDNCITYNNASGGHGGGIFIFGESNPVINNNIIYKNQAMGGGGIACYQSYPVIINNTIVKNSANHGGALDCLMASPTLFNTIIYYNLAPIGSQIHLGSPAEPNFYYCDIEGGIREFARDHMNGGNYKGIYLSNIGMDPLFVDTESENYHLSNSSHCIGSGGNSIQVSGITYYSPAYDFEGNARPSTTNSQPDMGAFENALSNPVVGLNEIIKGTPNGFQLNQNYPNPFNPSTKIEFVIPSSSFVYLRVYDVLGRQVTTLVKERKTPGNYEIEFNATALQSGVYFYRIKAGSYMDTKKMVLLK